MQTPKVDRKDDVHMKCYQSNFIVELLSQLGVHRTELKKYFLDKTVGTSTRNSYFGMHEQTDLIELEKIHYSTWDFLLTLVLEKGLNDALH